MRWRSERPTLRRNRNRHPHPVDCAVSVCLNAPAAPASRTELGDVVVVCDRLRTNKSARLSVCLSACCALCCVPYLPHWDGYATAPLSPSRTHKLWLPESTCICARAGAPHALERRVCVRVHACVCTTGTSGLAAHLPEVRRSGGGLLLALDHRHWRLGACARPPCRLAALPHGGLLVSGE